MIVLSNKAGDNILKIEECREQLEELLKEIGDY
jgi:hypothetical protein